MRGRRTCSPLGCTALAVWPERASLCKCSPDRWTSSLTNPVHQSDQQTTKALLKAGVVGSGGVEPPSSSVSDPTSLYPPVRRMVRDREGSMESRALLLDITQTAAEVSRLIYQARDLNLPVEPGVRDRRNAPVRWAVLLQEVLP